MAHNPDAQELLDQARAGDCAALGGLLERYGHYSTLLARLKIDQRLQGKVDPADLVQETFLKAHRDFHLFRGTTEGEFLAWLRRLLATTLARQIRHYFGAERRDVRLERRLADELDETSCVLAGALLAPDSTPSQQAARREQAILLANALAVLPPHYRDVIILHHLEGLSLSQVAHRMERTNASVEKLWTRALVQLRRLLKNGC